MLNYYRITDNMLSHAYDIARLWVHSVFRMVNHSNGFHVDKVLVFDESETPVTMYEHAPTNMTVKQLKEYVALKHYRIEVRYVSHGQKFRCIVRDHDDVHLPIRKKLEMKKNPRILFAFITFKDGTIKNVTKRVIKYAGPNADFNISDGSLVFASDIVPFHDTDRINTLRIRLDDMSDYYFSMDDLVVF